MDLPLIAGFEPSELLLLLVDLVLAVSLIELLCVISLQRRRPLVASLLPNLLAGMSLALALRLGLSGAGLLWVAPCLLAAGLAHLLDLKARWRRDFGIHNSFNPTHPRPSGQGRPS